MSFLSNMDMTAVIAVAIIFGVFGSILFFALEKKNRKYLFLAYLGLLIYMTVGEARDAYEVSVNSVKKPANIIIVSTNITFKDLEDGGRDWDISITFAETAGECASHGEGEGYLWDSSGVAWGYEDELNNLLTWGPIDVEAGSSFTHYAGITSYDGAMKDSDIRMTFTFTDDGGRTQSIPWTGHLE